MASRRFPRPEADNSAALSPSLPPDELERAEDPEEEDYEAVAAGVRPGGRETVHALDLEKAAVGSLSEKTRRYLHINVIGTPLPGWMKWGKQPKLNRWNYLMEKLHAIMNNEAKDELGRKLGEVVTNFMLLSIVISVAGFCLQTVPGFQEDRAPAAAKALDWVEAVTIQIFAADYLLRFVSAPDKFKFVIGPFNIVDLIAIVPWYVVTWLDTTFNGTTVFRVVRLFRVFRVLKLGSRYTKLLVVLSTLRKSLDMLGLMVFFVSLCIVFFATLMYYAERGTFDSQLGYYVRPHEVQFDYDNPRPSPFESIVSGFWWAVVTLMTVGYGDYFPITAGGKAIACLAMICGILTLALPISVIGSAFSSAWTAHTEAAKKKKGGHKEIKPTSRVLLEMQALLDAHVEDIDTLVELNRHSEAALEGTCAQLHHKLKATKKHLHTEAKADLRLRRLATIRRADSARADTHPYDEQYGYLSLEHVKDRYREQLEPMSEAAQALGKRACHVARMRDANAHLLDPELEAVVARLSKKHDDLALLLEKHEQQTDPLSLLVAEMQDLRRYVAECSGASNAAPGGTLRSPREARAASPR